MNETATSWAQLPFQNVVKQVIDFRGRTPLKIGMDWGNGEILSLSANNVRQGFIDTSKEAHLGSTELYEKWMTKGDCQKGDIVFTMEAPLGNVAQISDDNKYILSQRVVLLKVKESVAYNTFIAYLMRGDDFQRRLTQRSTGSTVTGIQQQKLNKFEMLIPPLYQQQKIAKILSTVDKLIEKTQSLIDKYTAVKQGMMADLFTRGIDLTPGNKYGQLRPSVTEAPELYQKTELGWVPKDWEVQPLGYYLSMITYGFTNPMPETKDGPWMVTAANVIGGKIDYKKTRKTSLEAFNTLLTQKSKPLIGDILLTKDGTLGRLAIVDDENLCINQSVALLRSNEKAKPEFIKLLLETEKYHQKMLDDAGGSTIKHIYITIVDKMLLGMPKSAEEQGAVFIKANTINEKIETEKQTLAKYGVLKKGLMQDLLTGKVRV
jgi:type I restriction enzyme S subunit